MTGPGCTALPPRGLRWCDVIKAGRVGAMLQSGGLMPEVTVRELVALVTGFHPRPLPVDETLKRAGIASFAGQRVDKLSGGQTQRGPVRAGDRGRKRPDRARRAHHGGSYGDPDPG